MFFRRKLGRMFVSVEDVGVEGRFDAASLNKSESAGPLAEGAPGSASRKEKAVRGLGMPFLVGIKDETGGGTEGIGVVPGIERTGAVGLIVKNVGRRLLRGRGHRRCGGGGTVRMRLERLAPMAAGASALAAVSLLGLVDDLPRGL
ncbi:hypothetical protein AXG93_1913s1920 [Marchantia polymorpha subsp. ruderalis]|uniref:Uncharacterized protein n=1 Tax=Marchantia polymorpha subsp. ruderalis TaxID=1480154 RepID=A0A176WIP7_MARPO|nr:hypothetical protein AXG93_1913s1920 [Marchantia polymorpha subsp. ruderalis]